MLIQMFGQTKFFGQTLKKENPVAQRIVFLHCVIWWLLYFGKEAERKPHHNTERPQ